jgi:butyrate kinase
MAFSKILVVFPQENNTTIAIYRNSNLLFLKKINHNAESLASFKTIADQWEYRTKLIYLEMVENELKINELGIIISRGGLIKPLKSGVYLVNEDMKKDLYACINGEHAINLGGLIADALLQYVPNAKACIADPVVVDELEDVARITGHPGIQRKSIFHALNQKYIARIYARSLHKTYEEMDLVVAHMGGGGCSIAAHHLGKVVDVNQAFDGTGPFAMTRTGTLPAGDLIRMCYSGKYTQEQMIRMITREGGLYAHLGTINIDEIETMVEQEDEHAKFILYALAYEISKEIAAMYTVLRGNIDGIILSGDIFNIKFLTNNIISRVEKLGKTVVFSTVNDIDALALNGMMVINGETELLTYS